MAPPPPAAPGETPELRLLRRLTPSRVALHLDLWRGAPSRELVDPLAKAEALYAAGDLPGAEAAADQLSVRFAEPRWPTLPIPFRALRVEIPPPMPPQYDPEFPLPAPEKEARKARRHAETQLALARGSVEWAAAHAIPIDDAPAALARAEAALGPGGAGERFWPEIDAVWASLRVHVPMPTTAAARPVPVAPEPAVSSDITGDS